MEFSGRVNSDHGVGNLITEPRKSITSNASCRMSGPEGINLEALKESGISGREVTYADRDRSTGCPFVMGLTRGHIPGGGDDDTIRRKISPAIRMLSRENKGVFGNRCLESGMGTGGRRETTRGSNQRSEKKNGSVVLGCK